MSSFKLLVPWLQWALREQFRGIAGIPGAKNEARILEYFQHTTLKATTDEVSWCSAFMNCCMAEIGLQGTRLANARSWLKWEHGEECEFKEGAIVVFWRGSPSSWQGHVAIAVKKENGRVWCVGGNQSNRVTLTAFPESQVLGYRWPKGIK